MSEKIEFRRAVREAKFRSPLAKFELTSQKIEFRKDPLTGRRCRINLERASRVKQAAAVSQEVVDLIERSKKGCFFCSENIEKSTPMFPQDPPRIKVGSATAFPNLFPFGEFHAVVTFSKDHHLPLDHFSPELISGALAASLQYFKMTRKENPEVNHCTINWNYMPPAASSILHPHLQILADFKPTTMVDELLHKSKAYFDKNGSNYWADLVKAEKSLGERYITNIGSVAWLASFAPQGNNETTAVFSGISNVYQMGASELSDFSIGLSKILRGYQAMGVGSLNMTFFSGPNDRDLSDYFLLSAKLISRPAYTQTYTSDSGFMERFHYEAVLESRPEDVARRLREALK